MDGPTKRTRRATAADVASLAGVSRSAVSRAFTEGAYLDAEKRERILRAAEEIGYRPNALAAGLQGQQSNLVAIFVGDMPNQYDKEAAARLATGLNAAGKWPIMIGGSDAVAREAASRVLSFPLEAMILRSGSLGADVAATCIKMGVPVISSGRIIEQDGVDNICVRNREGMRDGVAHLIKGGCRSIAYIGGPASFSSAPERRAGCLDALGGMELIAECEGLYTMESGYEAARALMKEHRPDALVCANDAMALGAMTYLREAGFRIPDDIALLGFDDIEMSGWPAFDLTTIRNPIDDMVAAVTELLHRRAVDPAKDGEVILLDTKLVRRGSTRRLLTDR